MTVASQFSCLGSGSAGRRLSTLISWGWNIFSALWGAPCQTCQSRLLMQSHLKMIPSHFRDRNINSNLSVVSCPRLSSGAQPYDLRYLVSLSLNVKQSFRQQHQATKLTRGDAARFVLSRGERRGPFLTSRVWPPASPSSRCSYFQLASHISAANHPWTFLIKPRQGYLIMLNQ